MRLIPPYFLRRCCMFLLPAVGAFLLTLGVGHVDIAHCSSWVWPFALTMDLVISLAPFALIFWFILSLFRMHRRIAMTRGRMCLSCAYDLRGSPVEGGRCPECGTSYTREALSEAWGGYLAFPPCVARLYRSPVVAAMILLLLLGFQWSMLAGSVTPQGEKGWTIANKITRVLVLSIVGVTAVRWYRLRRRVQAAGLHVCPVCGMHLCSQPAEAGACPKCGEPYTRESLRQAWRCFAKEV